MNSFSYQRAATVDDALAAGADAGSAYIAGGTEMLNWLKEGIVSPARLTDIDRLPDLRRVQLTSEGLYIGALARMSEVAVNPDVQQNYPVVSQALLKSASAQLRNMASMGGNLMQRTRCPYFRAETELPCNKRRPGSGCSALDGEDRALAIFGGSEACIATHPSDVAVALAALDAVVLLQSREGNRRVPLVDFHLLPGATPERETVLRPSELVVGIHIPTTPLARRSLYLKLRERASYEFALVSTAVALDANDGRIQEVKIALGGVAPKPWRLAAAERALRGLDLEDLSALRGAVDQGFADARPGKQNGFKIELAARLVVRGLQQAGAMA